MSDVENSVLVEKNFDQSTQIYDAQLYQHGQDFSSYIGLANSYAQGGCLSQAFDIYRQAFEVGENIQAPEFNELATSLINFMVKDEQLQITPPGSRIRDIFFLPQL